MMQSAGYGRRFAETFHLEDAPVIRTRCLRHAAVAITEIRDDDPQTGMSRGVPVEDAYIVALQLRDYPRHEHWEDGRRVALGAYRAGHTTVYDLKRSQAFEIVAPFHSVHFYLPRAALDSLAEEAGASRIGELDYQAGVSYDDATVRNVGGALLDAFAHPEQVSRIFVDHVALAVAAHVARAYGGMTPVARPVRGGLAPWQERRALEILASRLGHDVSLQDVAAECSLSVSHFSRAFRRSTGLAPHAWLLRRRVEAAKAMLRKGSPSLSDVALACGFADQSHFTRVFSRHVGVTPGAWRRAVAQ
jgi:AraC-like DNA-binding protein